MKTVGKFLVILMISAAGILSLGAGEESKPQSLCPVQGGSINPEIFVDADGYRIYACCAACLEEIKADPKAALEKIKANGETPQVIKE